MQTTRSGDFRSILVFGGFVAVIPLVFFPNNWGLPLSWNFFLVAGLELGLYFLIWTAIFPQRNSQNAVVLAFQTALLRWGCGILFGTLTFLLAGVSWREGIGNGLYKYFPSIFIQVVAAPLIIKSVWLVRSGRPRSRATFSRPVGAEDFSLAHKGVIADDSAHLDEILGYIKDYSGVEVCLLVDQEGLILAQKGDPQIETEALAPLAGLLESSALGVMGRIGEKKIERMETFTPRLRFLAQRVLDFWLVVISSRQTDDLLHIRIQRVIEQLNRKFSEKYPQEVLSQREEAHVRNS